MEEVEKYSDIHQIKEGLGFLLNSNGEFEGVSKDFCEKVGRNPEEIIGISIKDADFFPGNVKKDIKERIKKARDGKETDSLVLKAKKNNKEISFGKAVNIKVNGKGSPKLLFLSPNLEKSQSPEINYKKLYEYSPDASYFINKDGIVKAINKTFEKRTGKNREDIIGKHLSEVDIFSKTESEKILEKFETRMEGKEVSPYVIEVEFGDCGVIYSEVNANTVKSDGEIVGEICVTRDVTEREKTKNLLQKTKERYEELFDGANDMVVTTDPEGNIKKVNKKVLEFSKYSKDEIIGQNISELAHVDDMDKYIDFWKKIQNGKEPGMVARAKGKNGEVRWLKVGGRSIKEGGDIVEIQYNAQDITDQKNAEKRREYLHSLLRHDLWNKLSVIEGYFDLLSDVDISGEESDYVEKARKTTRTCSMLIEKIRTLNKVSKEDEIQEVNVDTIIEKVISERESQAKDSGIEIKYEKCDHPVMAGPLLEELFSNLIENAIEHSNCSEIRLSAEESDGFCRIIVEDDGKGIPDDKKEKVFNKGYTIGGSASSGLGMYLIKRIVESYEGEIELKDSNLGGARFDVYLKVESSDFD